jgi:hypothetical protein
MLCEALTRIAIVIAALSVSYACAVWLVTMLMLAFVKGAISSLVTFTCYRYLNPSSGR